MISRIIEWCEQNRFLVFTAVLCFTLAGIWSMQHTSRWTPARHL